MTALELGTFHWSQIEENGPDEYIAEESVKRKLLPRSIGDGDMIGDQKLIRLLLIPGAKGESNKQYWFICQWDGSSMYHLREGHATSPLVAQFHPGIVVHCARSLLLQDTNSPNQYFRYESLSKNEIQLVSRTLAEEEDAVLMWDDSVQIHSAVSATFSSPQRTNSMLLQSCLKRQMTGAVLLWLGAKQIETTMEFNFDSAVWTFRLENLRIARGTAGWARITPNTNITIIWSDEASKESDDSPTSLDKSPFASPAYNLLQENVSCMTKTTSYLKSILLTGPPGVGKTHAVRMLSQTYGLEIQIVSGGSLSSSHGTGSATKMMDTLLKRSELSGKAYSEDCRGRERPRIVFVDECDALFPAQSEEDNRIMESTLCYCFDQLDSTLLVAATNRPQDLPQRLRQRFERELHISPPRGPDRLQILQTLLPDISNLESVAEACVGYVAADLAALVARAHYLSIRDFNADAEGSYKNYVPDLHEDSNDGWKVSNMTGYLRSAMTDVGPSSLRELSTKISTLSWDDIVGNDQVKKMLQQAIEWPIVKRRAFRELDLKPPRGILLYGPPGCAKTSLAKAAARGRAFCSFSPADVYSTSYVGDAEAVVRGAFATARAAAPCILFFDELDAIVLAEGASSSRGNHVEARVLSTFLNEMDGLDTSDEDGINGVLVIAATNRPSLLDAALLRPGRLDRLLYVPPPDESARRGILEKCTKGAFDESAVRLSEFMTGAEIVGACREAILECAADGNETSDRIREAVSRCLSKVKPLLSDESTRESYRLSSESTMAMGRL